MATEKKSKYASAMIAIGISLLGLAASWGASKAEAAAARNDIQTVQTEVSKHTEKIQAIEVKGAREEQILIEIREALKKIQEDVEYLKSRAR